MVTRNISLMTYIYAVHLRYMCVLIGLRKTTIQVPTGQELRLCPGGDSIMLVAVLSMARLGMA
jgi:hypothetical protein